MLILKRRTVNIRNSIYVNINFMFAYAETTKTRTVTSNILEEKVLGYSLNYL